MINLSIPGSHDESRPRARLSDRNRVFLLVSNIYPAVLGTMIWALISEVPADLVSWVAILLVVSHFSLDLLYLKLNLEYYDAENDFRYGWSMFFIDVAIVALIRLAFGTIPAFDDSHDEVINPMTAFAGIYCLYLAWEYLYYLHNTTEKRSPASSVTHYWYLAGWFSLCSASYAVCVSAGFPTWSPTVVVVGFLAGVAVACVELYWSVFVAVSDTRTEPPEGVAKHVESVSSTQESTVVS